MHVGLHSGEVELMEENADGIAVHMAERAAPSPPQGEVLISSTIKHLVAGSGIRFVALGAKHLKGSPTNSGCSWLPRNTLRAAGRPSQASFLWSFGGTTVRHIPFARHPSVPARRRNACWGGDCTFLQPPGESRREFGIRRHARVSSLPTVI
jgi:hypothetical protein